MRDNIRLFISNPQTESVSYQGYRETLEGMAVAEGIDAAAFNDAVFSDTVVSGQCIHHREAPECLAAGAADAAIVYYHLALRYSRIFPDIFDMVPLGGTRTRPAPHPDNRTAAIHIGPVGDGGPWGTAFLSFMQSRTASDIYRDHGLIHALELEAGDATGAAK